MTDDKRPGIGATHYEQRPGRPGPSCAHERVATQPSRAAGTSTPESSRTATGIRWDVSRVALDRIRQTSVERSRFRFEKSLPDLVWNAAALEGNTFTLPEVRTLFRGNP